MNRNDFINELKKRLRKLPYDEIKEAIDYYEGYFDDAGVENEQAVLTELGSPAAVASQIIANFAIKEADDENPGKKNWRTAWLVILAVFASPIAIPIALSVGIVALSLVITLSAVIVSFFAAGAAVFAGGLAALISGVLVVVHSVPTTLFYSGVGLILLGIGTSIMIGTVILAGKCFKWLSKKIGAFIIKRRAKGGAKNEI